MATQTPANARLIEVNFPGAVCWPRTAEGWEEGAPVCGAPATHVAYHTPAGTSPAPTIYGSHDALCPEHARLMIARCLRWQCRGAQS